MNAVNCAMSSILLHLFAAALYLGLAVLSWRTRWRGPALDRPPVEFGAVGAHLAAGGITCAWRCARPGDIPGGRNALQFRDCAVHDSLACHRLLLDRKLLRPHGRPANAGPARGGGCVAAAEHFPGQHLLTNADSLQFRAAFPDCDAGLQPVYPGGAHAVLMAVAEKHLHKGRLTPLLASLPPLLTMEALLFQLIHVAFALLTLTLASGVLFSESLFGKALTFNHKTVFAIPVLDHLCRICWPVATCAAGVAARPCAGPWPALSRCCWPTLAAASCWK